MMGRYDLVMMGEHVAQSHTNMHTVKNKVYYNVMYNAQTKYLSLHRIS